MDTRKKQQIHRVSSNPLQRLEGEEEEEEGDVLTQRGPSVQQNLPCDYETHPEQTLLFKLHWSQL